MRFFRVPDQATNLRRHSNHGRAQKCQEQPGGRKGQQNQATHYIENDAQYYGWNVPGVDRGTNQKRIPPAKDVSQSVLL